MSVPPSTAWKRCVCSQRRYGPRNCTSMKPVGGSQLRISVTQRMGNRCQRSWYSISVPGAIAIGSGERIWKPNQGGVIASRFLASAKKANTSSHRLRNPLLALYPEAPHGYVPPFPGDFDRKRFIDQLLPRQVDACDEWKRVGSLAAGACLSWVQPPDRPVQRRREGNPGEVRDQQ